MIKVRILLSSSKVYGLLMFGLAVFIAIRGEYVEAVGCASVGAGLFGLKTYTTFKKETGKTDVNLNQEP